MDKNNLASNTWSNDKITVKFTWIPGEDLYSFTPRTQSYGICFNSEGKIAIQKFKDDDWCLPGGTIENGEDQLAALKREFIEEVDIKIKNITLLGAQKVEYLKGHNPHPEKGGGDLFYQLRFYCEVDEVLPQTPDPDKGEIRDRMFVKPEEITNYFDWGNTGKAIFKQAVDLWNQRHS